MAGPPDRCSIRFFREGDEERLLPLLRDAFGRWPGVDTPVHPIDHLRWKLSSDETAKKLHTVVEVGSRAIGCLLVVVRRVKVGRELVLAHQEVDLAVHPDYQNMGIMKEMQTFVRDACGPEFVVHYGESDNPVVRKHDEERGRRPLANGIQVLALSLDPGPTPLGEGLGTGAAPPRPARAFRSVPVHTYNSLREWPVRRHEDEWTVSQPPEFDDRIDEFWEEASQPFEFIVERTKSYLNWRYCDPRAGAFTVRLAQHKGRILGYAVLCVSRDRAFIADLLVLPGRENVVRSLVRDALDCFYRAGVSTVRCWLPSHHPYRDVLLRQGFLPNRRGRGLKYGVYGRPEEVMGILRDPRAAVHVAAGDTDAF